MTNLYTMASSGTVMLMKDKADDIMNKKKRKATRFHRKGKKGERIDKDTGAVEHIDPKKRDKGSCGNLITGTIIAETMEIGKLVEAFKKCDSNDILNKIKIHLTQDAYRFKNVGKNSMVEALAYVMNNDDDESMLSAI